MMIQGRAVESMAQAHQQDLMVAASSRRAGKSVTPTSETTGVLRASAGVPVPVRREQTRGKAPRLGARLIEFGTWLGGAAIRTS
jgi:hypothetical protein